ncbi:hypothetical protein [Spirilliplanes yamanashiensis]|uniref:Uncharacterized protein n=1 Tax=Spirilliplanes yamanashiensis TaxID=42233 RepID=A0A8J4DGT9_9ACTN|nr:hypothetical protein [Spirilliplanes yamanashiensis]MDP9819561.1 hypothetical protein [Spirilliplanes yamanashiensis]GIJ01617.1 hypothetical protein Sya03_09690 [Spirilliplanes yamanashiensis]
MRRLVLPVAAALGLLAVGAGPASAEPAPAEASKAAPGKKVCTMTSELLNELSGLVATDEGYVVVNDGTDSDARRRVFFLDKTCEIENRVPFPVTPRDPEDLVLSPDGKTLWIADVGDNVTNPERRPTVALWTMPVSGAKQPVIHRFTYPDGPKDAEALLLTPDNKPIIVTKEIGKSGLYTPTGPMKANNTTGVPLEKIGEFTVPASTTPTGFIPGRVTVTGGAVSPDGTRVVLRTYSDAYEWDVTGGDIAAAVKNKPRVTPLPDEPFGEAIAYTPDGKNFLTVSDLGDFEDSENVLLRYTPATEVVTASAKQPGGADEKDSGPSWFARLDLSDITYMVGGVGVLGAILVGMGIFGIMRGRKRPLDDDEPVPAKATAAASAAAAPKKPAPAAVRNAETAQIDAVKDDRPLQAAGQGGGRGGVYGAGPAAPPAAAPPGAPPKKGSVYGGAPAAPPPAAPARKGGGVYGGTAGDRGPERGPERGPDRAPERGPDRAPDRGDRGVYGNPPPPVNPPGVYGGGGRQAMSQPGAHNPGGSGAYGPAPAGTYGGGGASAGAGAYASAGGPSGGRGAGGGHGAGDGRGSAGVHAPADTSYGPAGAYGRGGGGRGHDGGHDGWQGAGGGHGHDGYGAGRRGESYADYR